MPTIRGSSGPSRTVGPEGQAFAKWNPFVLGRKPGIEYSFTPGSYACFVRPALAS